MKILSALVLGFIASQSFAGPIPSIAKIVPELWQTGVDPSLKTLTITFDQPMRYGFSSWLGSNGVLPTSQLQSSSSPDGVTATLSVTLQPGKVYVFALNETQKPGVGFQNRKGVPLPKTFFVFQTAGTAAPNDQPPHVIATLPANGAQSLDSTRMGSVSVTFDKPMQVTKQGLQIKENGKDIDLSKARFQYSPDGKTIVLGYQFKPASTYEIRLNSTVKILGSQAFKEFHCGPCNFGSPRAK